MGRPLLRWLPALVIAATVLYTMLVYPTLPERMPTHWGINGQPNGWSSREIGAWILPALMVFLWLVILIVPKLDPRKANYGIVFDLVAAAIVTFQAVIQYATLSVAQGHPVDMSTVSYVGLGALFVVLGVAMPLTKRNRFFGIRTRWTLSDDTVWARTQKAGGFLMVASGVLSAVSALTAPPATTLVVLLASASVAILGSSALSYLYWRQR